MCETSLEISGLLWILQILSSWDQAHFGWNLTAQIADSPDDRIDALHDPLPVPQKRQDDDEQIK
jgi:hypothetical protein